jgi:hypothetical protein
VVTLLEANVTANQILYVVIGAVGFAFLSSISRRRAYYSYKLKLFLRVEATYFLVAIGASKLANRPGPESLLWGILAAFVVYMRTKPQSRHIPAAVRRRKEAEFMLKTGKKFDRKKYELDHELPFASGGGHHESNIRVVEKKKNRSKGAKSPWWDLLG